MRPHAPDRGAFGTVHFAPTSCPVHPKSWGPLRRTFFLLRHHGTADLASVRSLALRLRTALPTNRVRPGNLPFGAVDVLNWLHCPRSTLKRKMDIDATRFGRLTIEADDILRFPAGLLGLDGCIDWVLLSDIQHDALGWMQSASREEVALAVVSPRRFVPEYQLRVPRRELEPLALDTAQHAHVLAILSKNDDAITLNLKAPLVINLERRLGRQVITLDDQPVQHEIQAVSSPRKKIA
jgi:flagellar assembly factor FliW